MFMKKKMEERDTKKVIHRRKSQPNIKNIKRENHNYEPRDRRMSEPTTTIEQSKAVQQNRLNKTIIYIYGFIKSN